MKQVLLVFVLIMAAIVVAAVMGPSGTTDNATAPVFSGIRERMESAHNKGATLFQYKLDVPGVVLCNDRVWLAGLGSDIIELKLTSQERANLCLCKWDPETEAYYEMQSVPDPQPGDYFVWESGGLHGLRYTQ